MKEKTFKYKDIPKFTECGNYHIHVSLGYVNCLINRYLKYGLQLNPDFQRGHVWTKSKQIKYMEFLLSGGYSGRDIYFNCPGWMSTFEGDMVLVDGLQRLTAALKFMDNRLKVYGHYLAEYDRISRNSVGFEFYINNLKTRREVLTWYIQLNEGGVIHSKKEIDRVKELLKREG